MNIIHGAIDGMDELVHDCICKQRWKGRKVENRSGEGVRVDRLMDGWFIYRWIASHVD